VLQYAMLKRVIRQMHLEQPESCDTLDCGSARVYAKPDVGFSLLAASSELSVVREPRPTKLGDYPDQPKKNQRRSCDRR
jgi:hypothetical protein